MKIMILFLSLIAVPAYAQDIKLTIADGSSSGTYKAMFKVMHQYCNDTIPLVEIDTSGALDNLAKLTENDANGGFMHSDVIGWRGMSEPGLKTTLKTLLVLWPEDVHFVVKNQPYTTKGEHMWNSNTVRTLVAINDLDGLKVGSAGGGYVTAQRIRFVGELKYEPVQFNSGKEVLDALANGQIAAAVFVGAAPLPNLKGLGKDYKILTIGESTREKLNRVGYHTSTVTYNGMSAGAVTTVAADALLVAQQYKSPKWLGALGSFRQCFYDHLDEIRETPGMHKAWQKVEPSKVSEWPMYENLIAASPTPTVIVPMSPVRKKGNK